jgi:SPP1 family predicted phage head-tail adaptor
MIRTSELRHQVVIEQPTNADDGGGSKVPSWSTLYTTRAKISDPKAHEKISAEKMEQKITHVVTMRYRSGIDTGMRIRFGSRYFYIKTITNPGERNRWLVMTAEEKS